MNKHESIKIIEEEKERICYLYLEGEIDACTFNDDMEVEEFKLKALQKEDI